MRASIAFTVVSAAAAAHARPVDPEPPRDPSHVRHVRDQVGVAWLGCLIALYPEVRFPATGTASRLVAMP